MMTRLGDVCTMYSGGTPRRGNANFYNGDILWAKIGDMETTEDGFIWSTKETITAEGLKSINNRIFEKGTLLLAMYGSVGKVAIAGTQMATNQAILGIVPKNENLVDVRYLKYWFEITKEKLVGGARGVALQNISATIVKNLQIPLPPLPIQKKIAAILDAADALRQKDRALLAKYDELAQSLFLDMFGDPVTNPKGWEMVTIRNLIKEAKYGTSSKSNIEGELPYLRMNNITYSGYMDYTNLKFITLNENDINKYSVTKGDVVFNRTNSKELVGKTGIIETNDPMVIAGYLIRLRTNKHANPYYLWAHLNSKWSKLTLNKMCKNIVGMANINAQELQDILILKPPIELQNKFAEAIQRMNVQKTLANQCLQKSEDLFNSLLQRAFNGTLVGEEHVSNKKSIPMN